MPEVCASAFSAAIFPGDLTLYFLFAARLYSFMAASGTVMAARSAKFLERAGISGFPKSEVMPTATRRQLRSL
jgi:hypothetical protein